MFFVLVYWISNCAEKAWFYQFVSCDKLSMACFHEKIIPNSVCSRIFIQYMIFVIKATLNSQTRVAFIGSSISISLNWDWFSLKILFSWQILKNDFFFFFNLWLVQIPEFGTGGTKNLSKEFRIILLENTAKKIICDFINVLVSFCRIKMAHHGHEIRHYFENFHQIDRIKYKKCLKLEWQWWSFF